MGFEPARIRWAIEATGDKGLQQAMDHILINQHRRVPDYTGGTTTSLNGFEDSTPVRHSAQAQQQQQPDLTTQEMRSAMIEPVAGSDLSDKAARGRTGMQDLQIVSPTQSLPAPPPLSQTAHQSSTGFIFPALHSFPPFFTPQSHPQTWSVQASNWSSLIREWCKHHRRFFLDASGEWESRGGDGLLRSSKCERRLDERALEKVLGFMVEQGGW